MKKNRLRASSIAFAGLLLAGCGASAHRSDVAVPAVAPVSTTTTSTSTSTSTSTPPSTVPIPPPTPTTIVPANAGSWSLIPDGPTSPGSPAAWTGKELLVAESGCCDDPGSVNLTAYNPATHTWRTLPPTPLTLRFGSAGAWTGTEMIIAGGFASTDGSAGHVVPATDGAAWDAATNTWHRIAAMPTTLPGRDPTAVWTGKEMLVWSSAPTDAAYGTTAREVALAYNPATDTWRTLPVSGLAPRTSAVTVWTGKELVVWSGLDSYPDAVGETTNGLSDGARLDPATDTWRRLPLAPVPARGDATAVWSGREVLLWGGDAGAGNEIGKGAAYNPATDQWRALPFSPLRAKQRPASVWTGHLFVVIGGSAPSYELPVPGPGSAAYDPSTDTWAALPPAPLDPISGSTERPIAADQRQDGLAVWTGKSIVLVGGWDGTQQADRSNGLEWTPAG